MTDSSITPAQQAFIAALNKKLQDQFSSQLDGTFETMSVPNGFYWGIQFGPNNYYNQNSLNQVNLQAIEGSNGLLTISNANFTTLYNSIMGDVVFGFSQADKQALQQDEANNQSQIQAVINSWESDMGAPITTAQMQSAVPPTKLGFIQAQVVKLWDNNVDEIPTSMQSFKTAYQTYEVSAQIAWRLLSQSAAGMQRLDAARANSKNPTAANGGLPIAAGAFYQPFGPFPTQNTINGGLQTLANKASIDIDLSNFSSTASTFSVDAKAGFSIPILDFMTIDVGASTSYTLDKYASSKTTLKMSITYEGVTIVGTPLTDANLATDNKKGWYTNDVLSQAIGNTDQSQTGYFLKGSQYPVDDYFGPGKKFSRIKTWVLSQQPTISMQFCGAETSTIVSDFKESTSVSVKLFGIFNIGSASQSYEVKKVDNKSVEGCVTVEMGPPVVVGTTPAADATAYVIGGVPSYPPDYT